jgi:hypothetical protein
MRVKFTNISVLLLIVLSACSDKYDSLVALAPAPRLSFDRDTVVIRERDSFHVARLLNPFVRVYSVPSPPQMHVQYYDSSGRVHFSYRGVQMEEGKAIIVAGDSTLLFCSCDTAGMYPVDFYLTDHLGKTDSKKLFINCVSNERPVADLKASMVDSSIHNSWEFRFDASGSRKLHGLITGYYFNINAIPIFSPSPILGYTFHVRGEHNVSVYVTDDLWVNSDTITKKILIP